MGMLLRHRPEPDTLTTTECFGRPEKEEKKPVEKAKLKRASRTRNLRPSKEADQPNKLRGTNHGRA